MTPDTELAAWREHWQTEEGIAPGLRASVERETFRMRIVLALDVLVALVIGGGTIALAVRTGSADLTELAGGTWIAIVVAWTFRILNFRGVWSAASLSTAEFLDLAIRRCRARLRAAGFGMGLFAALLAFCLTWIYRYKSRTQPLAVGEYILWPSNLAIWIGSVAFAVCVVWYRRRLRNELANLESMRS